MEENLGSLMCKGNANDRFVPEFPEFPDMALDMMYTQPAVVSWSSFVILIIACMLIHHTPPIHNELNSIVCCVFHHMSTFMWVRHLVPI